MLPEKAAECKISTDSYIHWKHKLIHGYQRTWKLQRHVVCWRGRTNMVKYVETISVVYPLPVHTLIGADMEIPANSDGFAKRGLINLSIDMEPWGKYATVID
jgi:hypothetical protein